MAADLLLLGGQVITMTSARPHAEAIAIGGDRILAVGSTDDLAGYADARTRVVHLQGRTVVPGFFDSHCHLLWSGLGVARPSLEQARSVADVLAVVAAAVAQTSPGEWVVAAPAWRTSQLHEGRYPTRAELDTVSPNNPVYLPNFHAGVANSLALRLAGIDASTPDPPAGAIERMDGGSQEPNGVFHEQPALWLIERHVPPPRLEEMRRAIRATADQCLAAGVTSIIEPGLSPAEMRGYQHLRENGGIGVRATLMLRVDNDPTVESMLALLDGWGVASGFGDDWLRLGGIKLYVDGAFFHGKALLEEPYVQGAHRGGVQLHSADALRAVVERAVANGWQVGAHASGDGAVRLVLDAYERVHQQRSIASRRFQVIHAHLSRADDWPRMREMGVVVVPQPPAITGRAGSAAETLGAARAERLWPLRGFLDAGIHVAGGSDTPIYPIDPLQAIWSAVSRSYGHSGDRHAPGQRLSRLEALHLYTLGGAYAAGMEVHLGSLEPGKLADLAVLSGDPLTCPEPEIKDLRVLITVVGGQVAFGGFARE